MLADKVNASVMLCSRCCMATDAVKDHFDTDPNYPHADNRVT